MSRPDPWAIASNPKVYDTIGLRYAEHRVPEPRIEAQIRRALGDARRVCNVGAGAGSYEPHDRRVVAVEPSSVMAAQRERACVRAVAEALPFCNDSFDAATAFLTVHHWEDMDAGLAELCRVAPRRVVFAFDGSAHFRYWLVAEYLPEIASVEQKQATVEAIADRLGNVRVEPIMIPADCRDGFLAAYWRRPEAYLDADVRACLSGIAQLEPSIVERAMERLRLDLDDGSWHARHADLLELDQADFGYRLVVGTR